ncbi:MAG: signal peptide peptidase SppA [Steroidobacteraceae bacterium]
MAVGGFIRGVWRGLDVLRRFLHLLLLLLLFGFIIGALRGTIPKLPSEAALVLHPEGQIVEELSSDPLTRAFNEASGQGQPQTLLWDLTDAIRHAATDNRVKVLVLELDDMDGAGQPTLEELAAALRTFRATGKTVVAYGTDLSQSRYYLAAQADEIYLDPFGSVVIDGFERYRTYLKGALDKLSVDMHLFRVGMYKSAAETYTRTDMSKEDREESLAYLGALWNGYQAAVGSARQLSPSVVSTYANTFVTRVREAKGDAAKVALDAGLVTGLKSAPEVEQRLIELAGADDSTNSFRAISGRDYIRVMKAEKTVQGDGTRRVSVIIASGDMLDGDQPPGTIGGHSTAALLRDARLDDEVKAVVLRIDTGGGSALAAEQIYREVIALKQAGKPVVASFGDYAASGGYYIAAPADEIFSSANTITGSIGIFATLPTVDRSLARLGITVDGVGTTELSGAMRIDRPMTPQLRDYLQATVERGYEQFLAHVADGRKRTRDEIHEIAQGRVWVGSDARRIGLVDQVGTVDDAVRSAANRAQLGDDYRVERREQSLSWAQELALQLKMKAVRLAGSLLKGNGDVARVRALLEPFETEFTRFARLSQPNKAYAYCFCSAP